MRTKYTGDYVWAYNILIYLPNYQKDYIVIITYYMHERSARIRIPQATKLVSGQNFNENIPVYIM